MPRFRLRQRRSSPMPHAGICAQPSARVIHRADQASRRPNGTCANVPVPWGSRGCGRTDPAAAGRRTPTIPAIIWPMARAKSGLSGSISDAGWGRFVSILRAKAEEAGRTLIEVDPRHTSDAEATRQCSRHKVSCSRRSPTRPATEWRRSRWSSRPSIRSTRESRPGRSGSRVAGRVTRQLVRVNKYALSFYLRRRPDRGLGGPPVGQEVGERRK